ncbi:GTP 3',8-cyclase MoaA [Sinorhizobium sp. 8-89]|uniref:GTP 3',8-cyclase MoaA n=1 Tax=Sinorhizobium sp. 7-81 TaxID=3049087 RepID=UPI0024C23C21|nr:GTP 3',8-cyclase MoaA [Sinorhizobium sp. 7-81]MDK1386499.1 GTP 3',8-cyclase MoaA [Sinorhizobium sp. 7-81]
MIDRFGRRIDYLRLSVTDRCDLRCSYCIPKGFRGFSEPPTWLTFDEITRLVTVMQRRGLRHLRLTGGEPLTRKDLPALVKKLSALGLDDISMSTNGTRLAAYARELRLAGLTRLNVSLDSLNGDRAADITGRNVLEEVLRGLAAAKAAGFELIKINMVVLADTDMAAIEEMVDFCVDHGFVLRLIEAMPMGTTGRSAGKVDLSVVRDTLKRSRQLSETRSPTGAGPARYLTSADGSTTVGFITPISNHFCSTCNRVRLAVDGTMYLCLGQNDKVDFRPHLRAGCSDAELEKALDLAMELKPERHEFNTRPTALDRIMAATGG